MIIKIVTVSAFKKFMSSGEIELKKEEKTTHRYKKIFKGHKEKLQNVQEKITEKLV